MASCNFGITVKGLPEERANVLAERVGGVIKSLVERGQDLSTLDAVIIAADYAAALNEVEETSGFPGPRGHTNEDYAVGVAMAVPVLREDGPKSVMVLHAGVMLSLGGDDEELHNRAFGTLIHEIAHVLDQATRHRIWADYIGKPPALRGADARFWNWADQLITEYYACRVAAVADPAQVLVYANSLREQIPKAKAEVDAAIKEYRVSSELDRLIAISDRHHGYVLKMCAYLMGALDGLEKMLDDVLPGLRAEIAASYVGPVWDRVQAELRKLFDSYPDWPSLDVHRPLMEVVDAFQRSAGFFWRTVDGATRVDIPLRPETTPSFLEAANIRWRLHHSQSPAAAADPARAASG